MKGAAFRIVIDSLGIDVPNIFIQTGTGTGSSHIHHSLLDLTGEIVLHS